MRRITAILAAASMVLLAVPVGASNHDDENQNARAEVGTFLEATFNLPDIDFGTLVVGSNNASAGAISVESNDSWNVSVRDTQALTVSSQTAGHMTMRINETSTIPVCEVSGELVEPSGSSECESQGTAVQLINPFNVEGVVLTDTDQSIATGSGTDTVNVGVVQELDPADHPSDGDWVYRIRMTYTVTGGNGN